MNAIRKLAREVARNRMKKAGIQNICKPINKKGKKHNNSKFAEHWKEYVNYESV